MRPNRPSPTLRRWLAGSALLLAACAGETLEHGRSGDGGAGPSIELRAAGDPTPRTFTDGYAGQTPRALVLGLSRFDLLRSATDAAPVTLLDLGAEVRVDLLAAAPTPIGRVATATLPTGTFTHGRVRLGSIACSVDAAIHAGGTTQSGTLTIDGALGDVTTDGGVRRAGEATYTFATTGFSASRAGTLPDLPSTAGGTFVRDGGSTWLVFALPLPLTLGPTADAGVTTATMVYAVDRAFRWADQAGTGYAAGVFDVESTGAYEPVRGFGATDYRLEVR